MDAGQGAQISTLHSRESKQRGSFLSKTLELFILGNNKENFFLKEHRAISTLHDA